MNMQSFQLITTRTHEAMIGPAVKTVSGYPLCHSCHSYRPEITTGTIPVIEIKIATMSVRAYPNHL